MASRLLIANRGEIVRRIARTCQRLDMEFVTVHSEADAGIAEVEGAVASVCIGPAAPGESYLSTEQLLAAAASTGCTAVHPGYGFLSESAAFARAVAASGLIFVGPDADTIEAMGDKARAKALMADAGVPVIPGSGTASDDPAVVAAMIGELGLPVLLKPAAGGGGKGMELVRSPGEIEVAVASCIRVARAAFGDGRVLVERLVTTPRHIEVQIFGDAHGNIVHLYERECSLQRRYQKIVEEAPAPRLDDRTRRALLSDALRGARAIGYRNAGTIEFVVDQSGAYFFLEANARLQVEHPVTEEVTGVDLVEWQLRVAHGEPLPLPQDRITVTGHAIECRVYAEDPCRGFLPASGRIQYLAWPEGLRIETAVSAGVDVTPHYDPMLAKVVAVSSDRTGALASLRDGLQRTRIFGVTTNVGFLVALLAEPAVADAFVDVGYVDAGIARIVAVADQRARAAACAAAIELTRSTARRSDTAGPRASPWLDVALAGTSDRVHLDLEAALGRVSVRAGLHQLDARLIACDASTIHVRVAPGANADGAGEGVHLVTCSIEDGWWSGTVDGRAWMALRRGDLLEVNVAGQGVRFDLDHPKTMPVDGELMVAAPMTGSVVSVNVQVGDLVEEGGLLAIVEAMKMENGVRASVAAKVKAVMVRPGDAVTGGQTLVVLEA